MIYPTLYKRTSTGATQLWWREVDGSRFRTHTGQEGGAVVTSEWTQATAKNVGRANATTAEEQAHAEVAADYKKKLAQGGYHENKADIDSPKFFKPMLAKNYADYPIVNFEGKLAHSQPKLDGVRCIATELGLWTRQGKPILSCPHISEELRFLFQDFPDAILDGELYADKLSDDFNKIISLVRKKNPSPADLRESSALVEYHVYDFPSCDSNFVDRFELLSRLLPNYKLPSIRMVKTSLVTSQDHLDELNHEYLAAGYEGQIVRLNGPYKNGRSADLLKRKEFIDEEFEVVSINEGVGNRSGMAGFITYKKRDGTIFDSGIKGSFEYARQLLKDRDMYVGGEGTVRYFNLTPAGIPRFPITVALYPGGRDL